MADNRSPVMSARSCALADLITTAVEVEEEMTISSKDGRESAWAAVEYATWCIHADARQCLTQFLDYVSSDFSEPKEVLVGTLFVATVAGKPNIVEFILDYARLKWTESKLSEAAACLGGGCSCSGPCCDWEGLYECCRNPEMELIERTICVVELAFLLNRKEITDMLVKFVDRFDVTSYQKLFPHCSKASKCLAGQLLCAVSSGDDDSEQHALALLSEADPNACVDDCGRSALMHAVLHQNEKLVKNLLSAGASVDHVDTHNISVQKLVIYADAPNLIRTLCTDKCGQLRNGDELVRLGTALNNAAVVRALCEIDQEIVNQVDWQCVSCRGSSEMLNVLMEMDKDFTDGMDRRHASYLLEVMIESKRADLLPILLSHGNFFDVACSDGVHSGNVPMFGTCSTIAARVLLGEGVSVKAPSESETALHGAARDGMTAYCSALLHAGVNKFTMVRKSYTDQKFLTAADEARSWSYNDCALLIDQFFPSLYELCLVVIRRNLRKPVGDFVDSLPLPMLVKKHIVLV